MKILVIYGSTREYGNTEIITDKLIEGIHVTRVYLSHQSIHPIVDKRHSAEGFTLVDDDYEQIINLLLTHDILIFSTPIYWYGMTGNMKNFFDRWSQYLRDERFSFKQIMSQKKAYVVMVGGDQPSIEGLPLVQQFNYIFRFMGMEFVDYVIGRGNKPGDVLSDQVALSKAMKLNERLKRDALIKPR